MTDMCEMCGTGEMEDSPNGVLCEGCDKIDEERILNEKGTKNE